MFLKWFHNMTFEFLILSKGAYLISSLMLVQVLLFNYWRFILAGNEISRHIHLAQSILHRVFI